MSTQELSPDTQVYLEQIAEKSQELADIITSRPTPLANDFAESVITTVDNYNTLVIAEETRNTLREELDSYSPI